MFWLWLVPSVAVFVAFWADWACHVGRIRRDTMGELQTAAGSTWAIYYAVTAARLEGRHGVGASFFALTMVAAGCSAAALAHRRTARLVPVGGSSGVERRPQ